MNFIRDLPEKLPITITTTITVTVSKEYKEYHWASKISAIIHRSPDHLKWKSSNQFRAAAHHITHLGWNQASQSLSQSPLFISCCTKIFKVQIPLYQSLRWRARPFQLHNTREELILPRLLHYATPPSLCSRSNLIISIKQQQQSDGKFK